ncbi:MAG: hypothetical protein J5827_04635 [Oscillospiraceae bacterium]|nr:hypothetical protein [Oscillospiraceae bacterium]
MNKIKGAMLIMTSLLALLGGCGRSTEETLTDRNIPAEDITEFYYTLENVNFDAFYQRYRFYREDGRHMFYHETRERPGEYGPTSEEDITAVGTRELSDGEWESFLGFLKDGKVSAKKDNGESGSSGPWTFIYWKNDKGKFRAFEFSSYGTRRGFEEFCSAIAREEG